MKFFSQIVHLFPKKIVLPADLKQEIYQADLIEVGTQDSDKYRFSLRDKGMPKNSKDIEFCNPWIYNCYCQIKKKNKRKGSIL
mgnify:CR=1 FL=1